MLHPSQVISHGRLDALTFYQIMRFMRSPTRANAPKADAARAQFAQIRAQFSDESRRIEEAVAAVRADVKSSTQRVRPIESLGRDDADESLGRLADGEAGFLSVMHAVMSGVSSAMDVVGVVSEALVPRQVVMAPARLALLHDVSSLVANSRDANLVQVEMQMNGGAVSEYADALIALDRLPAGVLRLARGVERALSAYYDMLHRRHAVDGVKIHGDPVVTDIAMLIERNTDRAGEIMEGDVEPDRVSAYSRGRAATLAAAVREGVLAECLKKPEAFMGLVVAWLEELYAAASELLVAHEDTVREVLNMLRMRREKRVEVAEFRRAVRSLKELDPAAIQHRPPKEFKSREERETAARLDETLGGIVRLLRSPSASPDAIIEYVLSRRAERRKYEREEETFFMARIGSGNPFLGVSPGEMSVYAAARPTVVREDIVGSGFEEVAAHAEDLVLSLELDALFTATHPTGGSDRGNVLMIGPPGSGKTHMLRWVGGRTDSVGIFVTGSDFQTCWMGEASKNPKRLWNRAMELSRQGKGPARRVYILIDEIDAVLREPEDEVRGAQGVNLVNELLQLLDGLRDYEGVSLWGATNHPERISVRMMRRFPFVRVVGELAPADRAYLLKRMLSRLPLETDDRTWGAAAEVTHGAVGDVLRKVADSVWRSKMVAFARTDRDAAMKIAAELQAEAADAIPGGDNREVRRDIANRLRKHFVVTGDDVLRAARATMDDPHVRLEVEEAARSYARARMFMESTRSGVTL